MDHPLRTSSVAYVTNNIAVAAMMYDHNVVLVRNYPCDQRVPYRNRIMQVIWISVSTYVLWSE